MRTLVVFLIVLLAVSSLAYADEEMVARGEELVAQQVSCTGLSDADLQAIGEYIMETMHPGDAHEAMDTMMGLEDNPQADATFHINLALRYYCSGYARAAASGYGMMAGGIVGGWQTTQGPSLTGTPYRGQYGGTVWSTLDHVLLTIFLIALILLTLTLIGRFAAPVKKK